MRWNDRPVRKRFVLLSVLVLALLAVGIGAVVNRGRSDGTGRGLLEQRRQHDARNKATDALTGTPWTHVFIAVNLYNNEPIVRPLADSLTELINQHLLSRMPPLHIFMSVFSNGSDDNTTKAIETLLVPAMLKAGNGLIQFSVLSNGTTCGNDTTPNGFHKKPKWMDRIEWMACVRNAAMAPLYDKGLNVFRPLGPSHDRPTQRLFTTNEEELELQDLKAEILESTDPLPVAMVNEDGKPAFDSPASADNVAVLFFNDILFQPEDIIALLRTKKGGFDMACGMDFYFSFYDTWVTRDSDGQRFSAMAPYASVPESQAVLRKFAGETVGSVAREIRDTQAAAPARCCWNGLAAIRGGVFLNEAIRFRSPMPGKCYASECTLFCEDIAKVRAEHHNQKVFAFGWMHRDDQISNEELKKFEKEQFPDSEKAPRIFVNPLVKVAYEEEYFVLHHQNYLFTSGIAFSFFDFFNVYAWKSFYSKPPPIGDDGVLQCVHPEDVKTYTVEDWLLLVIGIGCAVFVLRRASRRSSWLQSAWAGSSWRTARPKLKR